MFYIKSSHSDCSRISVELPQFPDFFPVVLILSHCFDLCCVHFCVCVCVHCARTYTVCVWTVWYIFSCVKVIFEDPEPKLNLLDYCTEPLSACVFICVHVHGCAHLHGDAEILFLCMIYSMCACISVWFVICVYVVGWGGQFLRNLSWLFCSFSETQFPLPSCFLRP